MHTLWRYIGSRFVNAFLGSLLILTLVALVVDMLVNIDEVMALGADLGGIVRQLLLRTAAMYLPYLIPVSTFVGAFVAIGQAARSREVVAMKAGGVSPLLAIVPVFLVTAVLALAALVSSETLTVRAAAILSAQPGGGEADFEGGTVWFHTGRFVYNVRDLDPDTEALEDVRVYRRDAAGRLVGTIHAARAHQLSKTEWRFLDATIRLFDPEAPSAPPSRQRRHDVVLELAEDRTARLLDHEIPGQTVWSLLEYVRALRSEGRDPGRAGQVLHERLTVPFLVLLFAVLAVPLGLRVEQTRSLALPALEGVVILFVFVTMRVYGARLMPSDVASLTPWFVVTAFFLYGGWQLRRVPR